MKLSKDTIGALKTISVVTDSVILKPGNVILAKNKSNSIVVRSVVPDTFNKDFPVWEGLKSFLSLTALFEDPDFDFGDKSVMITSGRYKQRFAHSDAALIPYPKLDPTSLAFEWKLTVDLDESTFSTLIKASSINRSKHVVLGAAKAGDNITVTLTDSDGKVDSNSFSIDTGVTATEEIRVVLALENVRNCESGGYQIRVAKTPMLLAEWTHSNGSLIYYISLERESQI